MATGPARPEAAAVRIGIDLGGTKIEGAAFARDGTPAGREIGRQRIPAPRGDYAATIEAIAGLVDHLEAGTGGGASVGIGMPGSIAPKSDCVQNANSTWLNGKPFGRDLEAKLERPVRLANDANCFAISEATDGAGAGAASVFGVILGTGCGGGIVLGGRLIDGPRGIGGEWGHNPLPWAVGDEIPGPRCWCGRRGCMETWSPAPASPPIICASPVRHWRQPRSRAAPRPATRRRIRRWPGIYRDWRAASPTSST